jgi:hypothetical protein
MSSDREEGEISDESEIFEPNQTTTPVTSDPAAVKESSDDEGEISEPEPTTTPVTSDPAPAHTAVKRGREEDEEEEEEEGIRKRVAQLSVTGSQRFLGHGKHDVTGLEPPYKKVNSVKLERRHEVKQRHFIPCILEVGGEAYGTFDSATSDIKFVAEECASLPTLGVRLKKPTNPTSLAYDERIDIGPSDMIEFDIDGIEDVSFQFIDIRNAQAKTLRDELGVLVRQMGLTDRDAFNSCNPDRDAALTRTSFCLVTLQRNENTKARRHDFSHFADSVHVDWSPKNMDLSEYHDQSQPYQLTMLM